MYNTITLAPLTDTIQQTPWGPEVEEPSEDEVLIDAAMAALFAGKPVPPVPDNYLRNEGMFGEQKCVYRPGTHAIIAGFAAFAAANPPAAG